MGVSKALLLPSTWLPCWALGDKEQMGAQGRRHKAQWEAAANCCQLQWEGPLVRCQTAPLLPAKTALAVFESSRLCDGTR